LHFSRLPHSTSLSQHFTNANFTKLHTTVEYFTTSQNFAKQKTRYNSFTCSNKSTRLYNILQNSLYKPYNNSTQNVPQLLLLIIIQNCTQPTVQHFYTQRNYKNNYTKASQVYKSLQISTHLYTTYTTLQYFTNKQTLHNSAQLYKALYILQFYITLHNSTKTTTTLHNSTRLYTPLQIFAALHILNKNATRLYNTLQQLNTTLQQ